jgi:hypothetical protein
MRDEVDAEETALRRRPRAHSPLLRLRSAGVTDQIVCEYVQIEPEGLGALAKIAALKLAAELRKT